MINCNYFKWLPAGNSYLTQGLSVLVSLTEVSNTAKVYFMTSQEVLCHLKLCTGIHSHVSRLPHYFDQLQQVLFFTVSSLSNSALTGSTDARYK